MNKVHLFCPKPLWEHPSFMLEYDGPIYNLFHRYRAGKKNWQNAHTTIILIIFILFSSLKNHTKNQERDTYIYKE